MFPHTDNLVVVGGQHLIWRGPKSSSSWAVRLRLLCQSLCHLTIYAALLARLSLSASSRARGLGRSRGSTPSTLLSWLDTIYAALLARLSLSASSVSLQSAASASVRLESSQGTWPRSRHVLSPDRAPERGSCSEYGIARGPACN